jgi:BNR repeat-like domain
VGERGLRGRGLPTIAVAAALGLLIVSAVSAGSVLPFPISEDPYTDGGTGHQHKTQVEPDSFAFGQTIVTTSQSGRWFAGGGASNNVFSTSQDGGRTWVTGGLPGTTVNATPPGPWPRISDPAVAYDPAHNVWLALGLGIDSGGVGHILLVNRSTNGGLTWSNPVTAAESSGSFWDKTWITCDTWSGSPFYGHCYIQFDDNGAGNAMRMVTSTDGGLTWGPVRSVSGAVSGLGGQPVVQPDGTVVVPYTANYSAIYAFRSEDGGTTWGNTVFVAGQATHSVVGMRDPPLPSAEVDGAGKVYVVWHDCQFRSGCSSNDIVMSTSADGQTWTAKTRIPIDPVSSTVDHFLGGIGVDRATSGGTAHLALGYYYYPVSNCSVDQCQLTFGFVSSLDGGQTWSTGKQVSGPMNPQWIANTNQGLMVGDYTSTSFTGDGKAHTVFTLAKPPVGRTACYPTSTNCYQRMAKATFDITAPPVGSTVRMRRDRIRYRPHRRPVDDPYYPRTH